MWEGKLQRNVFLYRDLNEEIKIIFWKVSCYWYHLVVLQSSKPIIFKPYWCSLALQARREKTAKILSANENIK